MAFNGSNGSVPGMTGAREIVFSQKHQGRPGFTLRALTPTLATCKNIGGNLRVFVC